jgi:hypothetical protein
MVAALSHFSVMVSLVTTALHIGYTAGCTRIDSHPVFVVLRPYGGPDPAKGSDENGS